MPEYAHEAMNVQVNDRVYNWLCGSKIPFRYVENKLQKKTISKSMRFADFIVFKRDLG